MCCTVLANRITHTHTHTFNGPISGTTRVSRYQKGKTNLDFTEARDSEWQWHQLGHIQVCTSLQTDNHASTPPLSFLQAGCPSCRPTNSVKALKAVANRINNGNINLVLYVCGSGSRLSWCGCENVRRAWSGHVTTRSGHVTSWRPSWTVCD